MIKCSTVTRYTVTPEMKLKAVIWYEPQSNSRNNVLLDETRGLLLGFEATNIYEPSGESKGCHDIVKSGLVMGSVVYGFDCRHAHDNVYMLK